MKLTLLALALGCLSLPALAVAPNTDLPLMPYPQQVALGTGQLKVDRSLTIRLTQARSPMLAQAVTRLQQRIERQSGLFLQPGDESGAVLEIAVRQGEPSFPQQVREDESYQLAVTEQGAHLEANTVYGALRGMETFLQLLQNGASGPHLPAVTITDAPRFPWRGVLIDSARHFMPLAALKRQLDGMASAKLNVFHWHLTDDQGWRFESKRFPRLQEQSSHGQFYSQAEMRELVDYAARRGIRVVPELDFPGHASALAVAYPELITEQKSYLAEPRWGVHQPLLDPSKPEVYDFIDQLVAEVAAIFPDPYLHIGGDEVDPTQWQQSTAVAAYMKANQLSDVQALHAHFNRKLEAILARHGRKMIGWDETLHEDLPKSVVIHSWQGQDALGEAAQRGHPALLSTGYYIDQPQPTAYHYRNDPVPAPLVIGDTLQPGEQWQSWAFEAPRKRGSPISGTFTLITDAQGQPRGFIDFKGKSRRPVQDIREGQGVTRFWLDSWMGKTQPIVTLKAGKLSGFLQVSNARYAMTGHQIGGSEMAGSQLVSNRHPVTLQGESADRVLGGEVTLWSEIVKEQTLDLRLWPRSYAIAERLWSAQQLDDEQSMYRRLQYMDRWGTVSVGLQHQWSAMQGMLRLANQNDISALQHFAGAVEQAQYYHRHHEKSANEGYDKYDPLNRLADALPPESLAIRQLDLWVDGFLADPAAGVHRQSIEGLLQQWRDSVPAMRQLCAENADLKAVAPLVERVDAISRLGLRLLALHGSKHSLPPAELAQARDLLEQAKQIQDELVVSSAYPIEKLLDAI